MRETITIECETNDFKAKALRWADENCHGDSMAKMAKKVSAEFGIEIERRTWARWYQKSWNLTEKKTEIGRGYKVGLAFQSIDLLDSGTIMHAWNSSKLTSLNTKSVIDAEKITEIEFADSVYGETLESEYKSF